MQLSQVRSFELKSWMNEDDAPLVIDITDDWHHAEAHLPEARHVPLDQDFEQRMLSEFPDRTRPIVVYGRDAEDEDANLAAAMLQYLDYEEVHVLGGGLELWMRSQLPVETSPPRRVRARM